MNRDLQITANHRSGSSSLTRCPRAGAGDLPKRNTGRFILQAVATEGNEENEGSREHRGVSTGCAGSHGLLRFLRFLL
jgi:hypothetical protein